MTIRRALLAASLLLVMLLSAALLSDGSAGGDEGGVLVFLSGFQHGGWSAMLSQFAGGFLGHRLFWLFEKMGWDGLVGLLLPTAWLQLSVLRTYAMVLDGPLFMVGAFVLASWHLRRRGYNLAISLLAPACLLVASSGICLFTGGFSECAMCLLVVAMVTLVDRDAPLTGIQTGLLTLYAALLIFAKLYALPLALAVSLLMRAPARNRAIYVAVLLVATMIWLHLESSVMRGGGIVHFYTTLMSAHALWYALSQVVAFFFSLAFGLLPCFPLLLLMLFSPRTAWRGMAIKAAGILCVGAMLLPFTFWYGPGGTAGPRYIVPFLLIFIPEIAQALAQLAATPPARRFLLIIPMLGVFFLPVLDYRNSLIGHYGVEIPVGRMAWPHDDPGMHPAVFAWRVLAAKARHDASFTPAVSLAITLSPNNIFPMTGLSRVIYLLDRPRAHLVESNAVHTLLFGRLLRDALVWRALRGLLAALILGTMSWAAWAAGRKP